MRKKRGMLKRILKITGIVLLTIVILVIGFVAFVLLDTRDIAKIDDSDLRVKKLNIASQDNSFDLVNSVDSKLKNFNNTDLINWIDGKNWDDVKVNKTLAENQAALAVFDQIATKKHFIDPNYDPEKADFSNVITGMRASREISRLALLQSESMRRQGDFQGAFNESEKVIIFGQRIADNQGSLVQFLVGLAIKNMGLDQAIKVVDNGKFSQQLLDAKKNELLQYRSLSDALTLSLKGEYIMGSNMFDMMADSDRMAKEMRRENVATSPLEKLMDRQSFYYKVNKTHELHYKIFKQMIDQSVDECKAEKNKFDFQNVFTAEDIPYNFGGTFWWKNIFTENYLGKAYVSAIPEGIGSVLQKKCDSEAKFDTLLEKMSK